MALVPSLWALWNMLWLGSRARTRLPIGVHGALLAVAAGAWRRDARHVPRHPDAECQWRDLVPLCCISPHVLIAPFFLGALAGYYLAWKYIVGFLNRTLEIA